MGVNIGVDGLGGVWTDCLVLNAQSATPLGNETFRFIMTVNREVLDSIGSAPTTRMRQGQAGIPLVNFRLRQGRRLPGACIVE